MGMGIELASIPLAFLAGIIGVLSPCVWPLVPVIMSSAANSGHFGPLFLALGLATAFAVAGTFLTLLLLNLGLNPDVFRPVAAALLILIAFLLISRRLGEWASNRLSLFTSRFNTAGGGAAGSVAGQFGIGALLGLVWLPCVGPTLGAAIALASIGQNTSMAFIVMFAFGTGTAAALLSTALLSINLLRRIIKPNLMKQADNGKRVLGVLLLALGLIVFTGFDKTLETAALNMLPGWALSI
ncbi:MAG TPA: cytochrome c biogenesis protein CcdA [Nitrosomonas sp.]|nr:cytochrome c biogenesis protein CcdA [Nitrosomonas sp.]HMW69565.1 cytochrome c biogenesis protein CcdA [Nitrosomonas sp.]HNC41908.1 cytochrome c biogenesis protein CcdA [Nitrosomonas sp.]HNM00701.1 cytochrome c biogenesis protein CcdA [Nitrosomonas sp.]